MINPNDIKREGARRRAEEKLAKATKREAMIVAYQEQRRTSEMAKIARLRALREARDTAAAVVQAEAASKAVPARRKRVRQPNQLSTQPATTDRH